MNEVISNKSIKSNNRFTDLFIQEGIETEFIEKGLPKLDVDDLKSINDIESYYILLSHEENHEYNDLLKQRLIKIEKEKLTDSGGKEYLCAVIEKCSAVKLMQQNIKGQPDEAVKLKMFKTTTHHIIVKGQYIMKNDDQRRTSVLKSSPNIYLQNVFNITENGSFILVVKNPELKISSQMNPNKSKAVELLQKLKKKMFDFYTWSPAQPEMLDMVDSLLNQFGDEIEESYVEISTTAADVIKYNELDEQ
ncbi:unnamed protein product [Rotaria magnacalcarata]